jgi:hypothetical protein
MYGWDLSMFTMLNDGKGGNKSSTTKQKMSISSIKNTRAVNVYKLDGTFIAKFDSPSQAKTILFPDIKDTTGGIIQSCNQSKQNTCQRLTPKAPALKQSVRAVLS